MSSLYDAWYWFRVVLFFCVTAIITGIVAGGVSFVLCRLVGMDTANPEAGLLNLIVWLALFCVCVMDAYKKRDRQRTWRYYLLVLALILVAPVIIAVIVISLMGT